MPYSLKKSEEFERLIEGLSDDIVYAKVYYDLFRDLIDAIEEYEREFNQTRAFWHLTLQAHREAFLVRLCRAYDQEKSALHLYKWLRIIRDNLHLFEVQRFKERLKDNAFVKSLSQQTRKPDPDQLDKDLNKVHHSDPLVKNIVILRNKVFAHRSVTGAIRIIDFFNEYPIKYSEIEILLDRAVEILNRYSNLFHATTYSTQFVGLDDFEFVLKCIRSEIERDDQRIQEIRQS